MRLAPTVASLPPALLYLLLALPTAQSSPFSSTLGGVMDNTTLSLQQRDGCTLCGYDGTACCYSGEVCYTDPTNDQASCSASAGTSQTAQVTPAPTYTSASWVYWTSTFTSTNYITYYVTYSSYVVPSATTKAQSTANAIKCPDSGETPCGNICCANWQYCEVQGQCAARSSYATEVTTSNAQSATPLSYTAPLRPTSVGMQTVTSTARPTTTVSFIPAVPTGNVTVSSSNGGGGLSGGAIAGIVIGVILGIIILILLCLCLCAGAAIDGILGFFGIGKKKQTRRTEEVEYYNRHGSRADGRSWYGSGRRPPSEKKKKSGSRLLVWGGLLAGLTAFAAALSFGRKKRQREEESNVTYDSYSSYESSDRRTADTRRSRR